LADALGLDERTRAVVYYTSLLINVGCHSDAHEQAKWFGDDIALKSGKYAPATGLRAATGVLRLIGAGKPPLERLRTALDFMISGRRDLDGMIESHARLAQTLARQLALPATVVEAVGAVYEYWDGLG
jgi:hypothetical protein